MSLAELSSRAIIGRYYKRLNQKSGMAWVEAVSNYFTSDQESETYKWLGQVPVMRNWVGGRQAKGFTTNGLTIENKHFEATLEIPLVDLRRDKTGQIEVRINELADRTNSHWAQLLSKLIINGESTVCYDGQYYFDTDHKDGNSPVQSNKIQVDLTAFANQIDGGAVGDVANPSEAALRLAILKTIQQILSFKDDQGEPMNENASKFLVVVPTSLWYLAKSAIAVPLTVGGSTNMVKVLDEVDISIAQNPRLGWSDKFAIFRTDSSVKPFIRQEEKNVQLKAIAEGSELEFKHDKHWYGVDTWRNVGYGFWQHACLTQMIKS
ncbi:Mu-like prophage major head subunit gpT family protein [Rickettsiales bacterium]|jgi:phage major head subunit gpT-like protein|nr:Mu-like prophage major head subunit gpT family protein [Rickettsiales bacterium]